MTIPATAKHAGCPARELWKEPPRGDRPDTTLLAKPWLDVLRAIGEGRAPQPPIAHLTGRRLVGVTEGAATFALPASPWFAGPKGTIDTGVFALLADMAHFYAVLSTLPSGAGCTTAEISMTFLRQSPACGGEITADSRVIYMDERNALSEGSVWDPGGRLLAHSTSRHFVFPPGTMSWPASHSPAPPTELSQTPDPIFRFRPQNQTLQAEETLGRTSGLEILQQQLAGEFAPPPVDRLTGIRLREATDGRVLFTLPAHGWLPQENGTVFGGMIALLAKSAAAGAVQTVAKAGTRFTALDLKVNFLRAVPADGQPLQATGTVVHRGRRLTIAGADVLHAGRRVAMATGTTALTAVT